MKSKASLLIKIECCCRPTVQTDISVVTVWIETISSRSELCVHNLFLSYALTLFRFVTIPSHIQLFKQSLCIASLLDYVSTMRPTYHCQCRLNNILQYSMKKHCPHINSSRSTVCQTQLSFNTWFFWLLMLFCFHFYMVQSMKGEYAVKARCAKLTNSTLL